MANKQPKFNRFPNTTHWTARYWCKVEMSDTYTLELTTRFQSTGEVTANPVSYTHLTLPTKA